jgi:magnesium-protoporphyrin IX monomethyl ester (oxidative) cyclase
MSLGMGNIGRVFQPLGLAYIASVLEDEHEVSILDANAEGWQHIEIMGEKCYFGLPFNQIIAKLQRLKPDVVGISIPFSVNEEISLKLGAEIKCVDKDVTLIYGGSHPTVAPQHVLSVADYVVIGEGEVTMLELLRRLETSTENIKDVEGIAFERHNKTIITKPRKPIENLDEIPFPARHLLPMNKYFEAFKHGRGPRKSYTFNERWSKLITSRGCPFNCVFCSIHTVFGRGFRARTPKNVVEEIKELIFKHKIRHINIEDDNMTLDKKRFKKICNLIIEEKLDFTWSTPNGIRADTIDEELVRKMAKSGCKRVFIAPESGVQYVVNHIVGKNLDLRKVEDAVRLFTKYEIQVDGSFVMGLIGGSSTHIRIETKREIRKTIKYALKLKKLGMKDAGFHVANPLLGTRLYELAKQRKFLVENDMSKFSSFQSLIETPEWTRQDMTEFLQTANFMYNNSWKKQIKYLLRLISHLQIGSCWRQLKNLVQIYIS